MKMIVTFTTMAFLAASLAASSNADAQYTNNKPLNQRPLSIVPRMSPHQASEERENMLQQQQMYRQDQDNFRHQMDGAIQQGSDTESKRELREKLREMLER
jgi:hypothetical protein